MNTKNSDESRSPRTVKSEPADREQGTQVQIDIIRHDLGSVPDPHDLPRPVILEDRLYYLVHDGHSFSLLGTTCPHMGGQIQLEDTQFICQSHGWRFDSVTGKCINAPAQAMERFPVSVKDDRLLVELSKRRVANTAPSERIHAHKDFELSLHAHACLEIRTSTGFTLLCDPWLNGPAFFGSWYHYPPPAFTADELQPDAIFCSHEHSDHFHIPSLIRFDRSTPVYVPGFPNHRMVQTLQDLGFTAVSEMAFGGEYQIDDDLSITCFEPDSLWNDAIVLIDIANFRLLNLNDAGINYRIADEVGNVDMLAMGYSNTSSGYPLTWNNNSDDQKRSIQQERKKGMLVSVAEAVRMYKPEYLLPFAAHVLLGYPGHREYLRQCVKLTLPEVAQDPMILATGVSLVDLYPGDSWVSLTSEITRQPRDMAALYDDATMEAYLDDRWDEDEWSDCHPMDDDIDPEDVVAYFQRLNEVPEVIFSENLSVRVVAVCVDGDLPFDVVIEDGALSCTLAALKSVDMEIRIPGSLLKKTIAEDLSWDEAHVGCWCDFHRSPDVFHANFWRLLQAPYYARPVEMVVGGDGPVHCNSIVGDVVELYQAQASRILGRYGLHCVGCRHAPYETIEQATRKHGMTVDNRDKLIRELNRVCT